MYALRRWRSCGIDLSAIALQRARTDHDDVEFIQADALRLPFITRAFDLELVPATPMTPESLRATLKLLRERGHTPQLVCPGPVAAKHLDEMAATAQQFQIILSFPYRGEPAQTVRDTAKATGGKLNYRVRNAAEAEFVAEALL